jgi:hypothetical protein
MACSGVLSAAGESHVARCAQCSLWANFTNNNNNKNIYIKRIYKDGSKIYFHEIVLDMTSFRSERCNMHHPDLAPSDYACVPRRFKPDFEVVEATRV